jgi:hypothetical protein
MHFTMRLCMFHPVDRPMERGWVGRIEGDRVLHLAAQTLQHFFTGGSSPREHAEYPLAEVTLLAPVPHPPAVRVFESQLEFAFANPAAVIGPGCPVSPPPGAGPLTLHARLAAVVGVDATIGGFTLLAEWRAPDLAMPKDRDFALGLGPTVVTPDDLGEATVRASVPEANATVTGALHGFDWGQAVSLAASGTRLRTGDLLVSPALAAPLAGITSGRSVELALPAIGVLTHSVC